MLNYKSSGMSNYFIVGASSGIGKQLGLQLSQAGHNVFGTYFKNGADLKDSSIEFQQLNVLDDDINVDFLPPSIDSLVYCPGSINLKPFTRIQASEFVADFNLQVLGAIKIIQAVLPRLKNSDQASILLFSSAAVQTGLNFHSQVSTSKGAIEGLTRALAAEFAPKIRVNCVAPSLTDTPLAHSLLNTEQKKEANAQRHPLKRIGTPEDIANLAQFLISDKSGWITGQIIHIDGGISTLRT